VLRGHYHLRKKSSFQETKRHLFIHLLLNKAVREIRQFLYAFDTLTCRNHYRKHNAYIRDKRVQPDDIKQGKKEMTTRILKLGRSLYRYLHY